MKLEVRRLLRQLNAVQKSDSDTRPSSGWWRWVRRCWISCLGPETPPEVRAARGTDPAGDPPPDGQGGRAGLEGDAPRGGHAAFQGAGRDPRRRRATRSSAHRTRRVRPCPTDARRSTSIRHLSGRRWTRCWTRPACRPIPSASRRRSCSSAAAGPGRSLRTATASYRGPFRFEAVEVVATRELRNPVNKTLHGADRGGLGAATASPSCSRSR